MFDVTAEQCKIQRHTQIHLKNERDQLDDYLSIDKQTPYTLKLSACAIKQIINKIFSFMDLLSTTQILLLAHCNCANGNEHEHVRGV